MCALFSVLTSALICCRAISLFRTSYSFVAQGRSSVPNHFALLWFAQYAPGTSSYTPFYIATETLPTAYTM